MYSVSTSPTERGGDWLKRKVDLIFAELLQSLEDGSTGALRDYLSAVARFHSYSWRNIFAIRAQSPEATRVAGRQTWREMGRKIAHGAQGIVIQVPILPHWAYRLPPVKKRFDLIPEGFRDGLVFDVAETEGDPLPERPSVEGSPGDYLDAIKRVIEHAKIVIKYVPSFENRARGCSLLGTIEVLNSLSPGDEFRILAHEFGHEKLHKLKMRRSHLRTVLETEAEAVAFVVCTAVGLKTLHISSDYIQCWNGKPRTLKASMFRIQRTAAQIIADLNAEVDKHQCFVC